MKLKHILPFASIASIATVAIPLATSCSCSSSAIDINENISLNRDMFLTTKDPIDFVKDQSYTFNIDVSKFDWSKSPINPDKYAEFGFSDGEQLVSLKYSVEELSVDGTQLRKTDKKPTDMENNTYCLALGSVTFLCLRHDGLTKKSIVVLKIKAEENKKVSPLFMPYPGL